MPDALVGARVQTADFPQAVTMVDQTANNDISSTTHIAGTPEVGVTFVAPTSGRVLVTVGAGMKDSAGNRVHLSPQVFLGTNSAGTLVLAADVTTRGVGSVGVSTNLQHYRSRTTLLTGLTGGATYYARTMHKVSGGTTADITVRDITVTPTT